MDFKEKKKIERPLSDLRAHIDYQAQLAPSWKPPHKSAGESHFMRGWKATKDEVIEWETSCPNPVNLDPFKVRDAFHSLDAKDDEAVLAFLNATGAFWRLPAIRTDELLEWQDFSRCVHQNTLKAMRKDVYKALVFNPHAFFVKPYLPGYDALQLVNARPENERKDMETGLRAAQLSRDEVVHEHAAWFLHPQGDALEIHPPFRTTAWGTGSTPPPHVEIRAYNVLQAVAACAYVDRFGGVQYRKCKLDGCNEIFTVQTKHAQQYCSASGCANTARQRRWLERQRKKKKSKPAKKTQSTPAKETESK